MCVIPDLWTEPLFLGYVLVFGGAAVASFASIRPTRYIEDDDTRRGLVALLLTSGIWSATHVAYLAAPTVPLKRGFYVVGLVVGIAAVGPWLYFCSAYTGRSLHRTPTFRRIAAGVFLAIVLVKLTNPLHGLYYEGEFVTTPFAYLAVETRLLHWVVMGLAYSLATVGYFMLLELFWRVDHDTRPLIALIGLTGLPLLLDIFALSSTLLISITYEPLGVAIFAIGVMYVYRGDFQGIQLTAVRDEPVILLDADGRVRDFNMPARTLFPDLEPDSSLHAVAPRVADCLDEGEGVIEFESEGGTRYFQVTTNPFSTDRSRLGEMIALSDVSEREQYRRELERQNERLERFAGMISHDLRNPLEVALMRTDLASREVDSEHLDQVQTALARIDALIDDLLALAKQGQSIGETEPVSLSGVVTDCRRVVDTGDATVTAEGELTLEADRDRLQQLLENLVRNAIEHGGQDVTIRVGPLDDESGFYVADDGVGIPEGDRESVFDSGYSTSEEGTGFGLAIVGEIVEAHGWRIRATESADGGARFEITGVSVPE